MEHVAPFVTSNVVAIYTENVVLVDLCSGIVGHGEVLEYWASYGR